MSDRRQVWETLSNLLARVEQGVDASLNGGNHGTAALEKLEKEVRKLGKAQFKANVLAEDQSARWKETIAQAAEERDQRDQLLEELINEHISSAKRELLETILPALDGVENAIASGKRYLQVRDRASEASNINPQQVVLVSPADRVILSGWLDGLRLVRERLLAVLEEGGVNPIPTVGQSFDPYLHVAVGTTSEGDFATGTIVEEERRGYRSEDGVLRYAEVVVYRADKGTEIGD
jgi:molecular chaperone GrpE